MLGKGQVPLHPCMLGEGRLPSMRGAAALASQHRNTTMAAAPACPHPPQVPLCCGPCIFENRRCDQFYPGEGRSEAVSEHLLGSGYQLKVRWGSGGGGGGGG